MGYKLQKQIAIKENKEETHTLQIYKWFINFTPQISSPSISPLAA